jgi:hypothetical protein
MIRFFKRIGLFIFPLLFIVVCVAFVSKKIINSRTVFVLPSTTETLVLGHSQAECALNDSLIDKAKNLAQGGEAYFYTYQKLRKLLPENPQVKTVYLSFSNNQIEKKMDEWTYDDQHLSNYFPKYSGQMDAEDYQLLMQHNPKKVIAGELKALKNNLTFILKNKRSYLDNNNWGGYLYLKRNKIDSLLKGNYNAFIKKETSSEISQINLNYLKKIVSLCNQSKAKLVFFRTPIHQKLFESYDEKTFQSIRTKQFNSIPFLDFHDFKLENDEYGDFNHLNFTGAKKFSEHFNAMLQQDVSQSTTPIQK